MTIMQSLALLVAHLLGDYVIQNDWMAKWKAAKAGTITPEEDIQSSGGYDARRSLESKAAWRPFWACTIHCLLYTLVVWCATLSWMPWWGLVACFSAHFALDRWRLARWWMLNYAKQVDFATGPLAPWSIIVVDNTFHLATLLAIGVSVGV